MQIFKTRQWMPYPVEQVFAFFAYPANLPRLMPARLKTRIEAVRAVAAPDPPRGGGSDFLYSGVAAGQGSEVEVSFCPVPWLAMRVRWTARIVEFAWNSHFCDEQIRGPFAAFRHRHGTEPEMRNGIEGTVVSDEIEYELPYGSLGRFAGIFVRKHFRQTFAERQRRLKGMLQVAKQSAAWRD